MITLEEFTIQLLKVIIRFVVEWESHEDNPNWPDEMEPEEWSEHFVLFIANQKEDDYEHFVTEVEEEEKRRFLS